jgi:hypothetical protein
VLLSQRPLEIESGGGLHQVKPWFEGRLDLAPIVSFEGDTDFPLKGEPRAAEVNTVRVPNWT